MIHTAHVESPRPSVTVVVPVYGGWDSLRQCIESLKAHVHQRHTVLLVNDCGPEAETIERNIRGAIQDRANFAYHRNPRNMGFVKTCNRAVLELDQTDNDILLLNSDTIATEGFLEEMLEVLYVSDHHGVVTPRSNNATLATVPLRPIDPIARGDLAYSKRVYDAVKDHLPRYAVVPVGVGFCLLVKRRLIRNFGLLDEAFGHGYNEENEFCLRINKYGYSSVLSNRAFVYHLESRSFSAEQKDVLNRRNELILLQRHGYYPMMVKRYLDEYIDPVDHFADVIAGITKKVKILINLFHFPSLMIGTTRNGISLLEYLRTLDLEKQGVEVAVLCKVDAASYHKLHRFGFRLVHPQTIGDEVFHMSFCPIQFFHPENLIITNRHALRSAFALLDVISLRCQYLLAEDPKLRAVFLDALRLADKVVTISEATKEDTLAYFNASVSEFTDKLITIHQGFPHPTYGEQRSGGRDQKIRRPTLTGAEKFILVFGNDYSHKAIDRALPYLEKQDVVSVIVGSRRLRSHADNIVVAPSGEVPDDEIEALLAHCCLVLFPSQYEGFGFPTLEAAHHGKPLLYYASAVGDEITRLVRPYIRVDAFETFDQLPAKIRELLARESLVPDEQGPELRSLTDYNREVFDLVLELARRPYVDFRGLRDRWHYFMNVSEYYGQPRVREYFRGQRRPGLRHRIRERVIAELKKYPAVYRTTRQMYRRVWPKRMPWD